MRGPESPLFTCEAKKEHDLASRGRRWERPEKEISPLKNEVSYRQLILFNKGDFLLRTDAYTHQENAGTVV